MESNFWKNKKVLVTGGTGFLGKHLTDALLRGGAVLRILDLRKPNEEINGVNFYEVDIRDDKRIDELSKGMDIMFHLAAMPSIARGKSSDYYAINVQGTKNILEAALNNGVVKVVYVSSSTVYGIPREFPLKETSPVHPIGKYSRSKLEAENLCWEFAAGGMDISVIRPRVIIGAGRIGIFSILFDRVYKNQALYIIGSGENIFQFTNVIDMAEACLKAAEHRGADLFNIGSEQTLPVREELESLIKHAESKSRIVGIPGSVAKAALNGLSFLGIAPLVNEQFAIADRNFKLDTGKARRILNWSPAYSNLDSLIQAYDWYIANIDRSAGQYRNIFGVLGKFKHSKMGGFSE